MNPLPPWLASTVASDASGGQGALPGWITARTPAATMAGPAFTMTVGRDDNSPMRGIPQELAAGTVLVVAGASKSRTAILGDLVARELLAAGIVGVVTDGLIRDSIAVAEIGLVVWSRGVTPIASRKDGVGHVGGGVVIGGVTVADGDLVVADADGVVIWPSAKLDDLLAAAEAKQQADGARLAALEAKSKRSRAAASIAAAAGSG